MPTTVEFIERSFNVIKDVTIIRKALPDNEIEDFFNVFKVHTNEGFKKAGVYQGERTKPGGLDLDTRNVWEKRVPINDHVLLQRLISHLVGFVETNPQYKIKKYSDPVNILKYTSDEDKPHLFRKHKDPLPRTNKDGLDRILSVSAFLTQPEKDYTGGGLYFYNDKEEPNGSRFQIDKGDIVVFPSLMYHEVRPVLTGTRVALIHWLHG